MLGENEELKHEEDELYLAHYNSHKKVELSLAKHHHKFSLMDN